MSNEYKMFQRILFHLAIGIIYYQNERFQLLSFIIQVFITIFDLLNKNKIFNHYQDEFENLFEVNKFLLKLCSETIICIEKNSQNQNIVNNSNNDDLQTYEQLKKYLEQVNPIFYEQLPEESNNIINLIEKMLSQKNKKRKFYKLKSIINQGKLQESNLEIIILKYCINCKNKIIIKFNDDSKQTEIIKAKELALKSIYHDIKNSLIGAQIINEEMKYNLTNEIQIQKDNVFQIDYYLAWTLNLINSYLDYCQSQVGSLKISLDNFDLYDSIMFIYQLMCLHAKKNNIIMNIQINQNDIQCINDERRFHQVLMNLMNNAIKFTMSGGQIDIYVKIIPQKNLIYLSVKDSGVGMSPEIMSKIGRPYQTFNQNQMNSHGNGIGLNSTQTILKHIGPCENLLVQSREGVGSEFSILIYIDAQDIQIKEQIQLFNCDTQQIKNYLQIKNSSNEYSFYNSINSEDQDQNKDMIIFKKNQIIQQNLSNNQSSHELEINQYNSIQINEFVSQLQNRLSQSQNLDNKIVENQIQLEIGQQNQDVLFKNLKQNSNFANNKIHLRCINQHKTTNIKQSQNKNNDMINKTKELKKQATSCFQKLNKQQLVSYQTINTISQIDLEQINILIVDDEQAIRNILKFHLENLKDQRINYQLASNGYEGLQLFKMYNKQKNNKCFHLIITDIQMPIMTGYQMSEQITNLIHNKFYCKAEIIALSSDQSKEYDLQCKQVGISQNYTKPIKFSKFKQIYDEFIKNQKLQDNQ